MVGRILCFSVVARMKITCDGGSSSVLRKASKAAALSMCTSSMMNTITHLKMVAEKEGVKYEEPALAVIAEKADGGMRDALSIFDQAASFCQGDITYQKVIEDLNVLDSDNYFKLVDLAIENKISQMMVVLDGTLSSRLKLGNDFLKQGF